MYTFVDGVKTHKEHPTSFWIPSAEKKAALKPGDFVKVGFVQEGQPTERMWVKVTMVEGTTVTGTLHNDPAIFDHAVLKFGDTVVLGLNNVMDILE